MDRTRGVLAAATLVATVATVGSLYFSQGLGLIPCTLCWYQRILIYPQVVILAVATAERRPGVWRTALPLSSLGFVVASYHTYLQVAPSGTTCAFGTGCASILYPMFGGLLTIPRLALIAFTLLLIASVTLASGVVEEN